MNKNRRLFKVLGFLLGGIIIALVFVTPLETYSWFIKDHKGPTGNVEAARTKDFIENMEIEYNGGQAFIKLEKGKTVDYSPIIFFVIEGDIKDYILHINSAKLEDELKIPIIPNVNLPQAVSLILSPNREVKGKIKIRHLNDFIDESLEVSISKKYLLERYFCNRGSRRSEIVSMSSNEKDQLENFTEAMISYTDIYMDWEDVIWEDWEEDGFRVLKDEYVSLPISKMDISSHQRNLIHIITPDLLTYTDKLYELLEGFVGDLNGKIDENKQLKEEKEKLSNEIKELEEKTSELNNEIMNLRDQNNSLTNQIINLESSIRENNEGKSGEE